MRFEDGCSLVVTLTNFSLRARQYLSAMPRDWFHWATKVENRTLAEIDFNALEKTNCRDDR